MDKENENLFVGMQNMIVNVKNEVPWSMANSYLEKLEKILVC